MDLFEKVQQHYKHLMTLHRALEKCEGAFSDGVGFGIQELTRDDEKSMIGNSVPALGVSPVKDGNRVKELLSFHGRYRVDPKRDATRFVRRMPGILVLDFTHALADKAISLCQSINIVREQLLNDTKTVKRKEDRHQIVHDAVYGFMSEHAKRKIKLVDQPVMSMSFNWACPPVPKSISMDNVIARMKATLDDPFDATLTPDLRAKLEIMLQRVELGQFTDFQLRQISTPKPVVMTVYDKKEIKNDREVSMKRNTSIATPWILCAQEGNQMPIINALDDYQEKPRSRSSRSKERTQLMETAPVYGVKVQ